MRFQLFDNRNFKKIFLVIGVLAFILSRTLFLERSSRFLWDESDDLVRMYKIFKERNLTLIGPTSQDKINIYGSLTYYMLLPFATLSKFDPIGPVIGAVFYSLLVGIMLFLILYKRFGWNPLVVVLFLTFVFPYLRAGRWAWNPNLMPFWQSASCLIYYFLALGEKKNKFWLVLVGFLHSLAIHNHWYATFALLGFSLVVFLDLQSIKKGWRIFYFLIGVLLGVSPFLIFDLTHPPGLFLTRMIYFSPISPTKGAFDFQVIITRAVSFPYKFLFYFFQNKLVTWLVLLLSIAYGSCLLRLKKERKSFILLLPVLSQFLGLSMIGGEVWEHYFLPASLFFILWLFYPKEKKEFLLPQRLLIFLFLILSIFPSISEILKVDWSTNIKATRKMVDIIHEDINGRNCNLAVLASPDPNTKGKRYRDLLYLRGISLLSEDNFRDNNCLYIISASSEGVVRNDPAYEVDRFRSAPLAKYWKIPDSIWYIYKFDLAHKNG